MANGLESIEFDVECIESEINELKEEVKDLNGKVLSLCLELSKESDKRLLLTILFGLFLVYFIFSS